MIIYPAEFERKMQEYLDAEDADHYDFEQAHINADHLICEVLKQLGYEKGVEIFHKLGKWYA